MLGTGAHAAVADPSHEEVDMRRPEGSNRVGQLELVDCTAEVTEGLGVGLHCAVRLASTVQAVRWRGMSWSSIGKCNLLKSGGPHITPSCRG